MRVEKRIAVFVWREGRMISIAGWLDQPLQRADCFLIDGRSSVVKGRREIWKQKGKREILRNTKTQTLWMWNVNTPLRPECPESWPRHKGEVYYIILWYWISKVRNTYCLLHGRIIIYQSVYFVSDADGCNEQSFSRPNLIIFENNTSKIVQFYVRKYINFIVGKIM